MAPPAVQRREYFGLSFSGLVSLTAVLAVLVVVSLPRLRGLALHENEVDARATAQLLARALAQLSPSECEAPFEHLAQRTALARALRDAEWLEEGRVLRLHGYLFELCPAPAPLQAAGIALALAGAKPQTSAPSAVRAWPWSAATGRAAFVASGADTLLMHANADGHWQGLERRPPREADLLPGWRALP